MPIRCRISLYVLLLGVCCSVILPAAATPPLDAQVKEAARAWLQNHVKQQQLDGARINVTVLPARSSLAERHAVPACDAPAITAADTRRLTRMRFAARCPGAARATIYLVRGEILVKVLTAATHIPAGQPLTQQDVARTEHDLAQLPDALTDPAKLAGSVSRRALKPGQVIQARLLKSAQAVRRGQAVQIVVHTPQLEVSTIGTALEDGTIDETIEVRNASTGKVIHARVAGPGRVEPVAPGLK